MYQSICKRYRHRWFGKAILPTAVAGPFVGGAGLLLAGQPFAAALATDGGVGGYCALAVTEYIVLRRLIDENAGVTEGSRRLQRAQIRAYVLGFAAAAAAVTGMQSITKPQAIAQKPHAAKL